MIDRQSLVVTRLFLENPLSWSDFQSKYDGTLTDSFYIFDVEHTQSPAGVICEENVVYQEQMSTHSQYTAHKEHPDRTGPELRV